MQPRVVATVGCAALVPEAIRFSGRAGELVDAVLVARAGDIDDLPREALESIVLVMVGEGRCPVEPLIRVADDCARCDVDEALRVAAEVWRLRRRLEVLHHDVERSRERQVELLRVGAALTAEKDLDALLELLLATAMELGSADAGSLYLVDGAGGQKVLRFKLSRNASMSVPLAAFSVAVDNRSLAGYVALSGETITVDDVRRISEDAPYGFDPSFDKATGYHTRSLLATPMTGRSGDVVGVLQLLNHTEERGVRITAPEAADRVVTPFGDEESTLVRALAAQAAVAIENTRLVVEIEELFESFVQASVTAIEQRDPTTSGHSQRVAATCVELARIVGRGGCGGSGVEFSQDELTQLRYAALLHDFGKVGVREAVLTKERRLFPDRLVHVRERFRHAKRALEAERLRAFIEQLVASGRAPVLDDLRFLDEARAAIANDLAEATEIVARANMSPILDAEVESAVLELARRSFPGVDGAPEPMLRAEEVRSLSVRTGSLDAAERQEIEGHVVHSYQFLLTLPWPRRFTRIPEIAYAHHENPLGRGYPQRLSADEIPLEAKIIAVCDVFDALSASDRPYKPVLPVGRALEILREDAEMGRLDRQLVEAFISHRVWARAVGGTSGEIRAGVARR